MITQRAAAILTEDIWTRIGYYTKGTEMEVLGVGAGWIDLCLDNGFHPAGVCHQKRVPARAVHIKEARAA